MKILKRIFAKSGGIVEKTGVRKKINLDNFIEESEEAFELKTYSATLFGFKGEDLGDVKESDSAFVVGCVKWASFNHSSFIPSKRSTLERVHNVEFVPPSEKTIEAEFRDADASYLKCEKFNEASHQEEAFIETSLGAVRLSCVKNIVFNGEIKSETKKIKTRAFNLEALKAYLNKNHKES